MLNTNILFWISTICLALGVGILAHRLFEAIFSLAIQLYDHTPGRRMTRRLKEIGLAENNQDGSSFILPAVNAIRRQASFPMWVTIAVIALTLLGYIYTRSFIMVGVVVLYILARMWLRYYFKRKESKDVWLFLLDLRTKLTLKGSLLTALNDVSQEERTMVARICRVYLDAGFQGNGLNLLAKVAEDTRLPFLDDVVARTVASTTGKLSLDAGLRQAIEIVQQEIDVSAREQLQSIPSRLIIIVFPMLLGPGLVVLLYPVVSKLLASMSGMGGG